jgi:hypothetical protein
MKNRANPDAGGGDCYVVGLEGAYAIAAVEGIVYTPEMRRVLEAESADSNSKAATVGMAAEPV